MKAMTLAEIALYTGSRAPAGAAERIVTDVTTDSRRVTPGCLFVALRGERFDGHAFVPAALAGGAAAALVSDSYAANTAEGEAAPCGEDRLLRVPDTLRALGQLARGYHTAHFPQLRRLAVTGSVGKTTTKDMLAHVLSVSFQTRKTPMNFNNEIGLPLTVLGLEEGDTALVTEMGMRGLGQIRDLAEIVLPEAGIITNIGSAHLELLGTRENILRAKMELCFAGRFAGSRTPLRLFVNGDDDLLGDAKRLKTLAREYGCHYFVSVPFGLGAHCAYRATDVSLQADGVSFVLLCGCGHFTVRLQVPGIHNVYNALAAIACAASCGVPVETCVERIASFGAPDAEASRQRIVRLGRLTLLDDSYNASPESMRASLQVLQGLDADVRVAVLGDMLELGSASEAGHAAVGRQAQELVGYLFTVGERARQYGAGFPADRVESFPDVEQAIPAVLDRLQRLSGAGLRAAVLVKGSHAMQLDRAADAIRTHFTGAGETQN